MKNRSHLKIFTTVLSVLACCAFLPTMQAQLPPEIPGNPDGCYPAFTTAEGCNALHQLFGGLGNTGVGWYSNFLAGDASFNTGVGAGTLAITSRTGAGTAGDDNTAVGTAAMILNLSGSDNTAVGTNALVNNMIASDNTAVGSFALHNNDSSGAGTAHGNSAFGLFALFGNIDGAFNSAFGDAALSSNINAGGNTAIGDGALMNNDSSGSNTAINNTAVGDVALFANIDGDSNTAVGAGALRSNTTSAGVSGISNNAVGRQALFSNTTGSFNEALGVNALTANTTSDQNVAIGDDALSAYTGPGTTAGGNTAVGGVALSGLTTGTLDTALGIGAGAAQDVGTNDIYIGDTGVAGETNVIAIGALASTGTPYTDCFIGGIFGNLTPGAAVFINAAGHLSTTPSSLRFKDQIKPMDKTSEAIFSLRPVTFHYKGDNTNMPQFGLIAEEVVKVNSGLIIEDKDGKPYGVRYEQINAMLLNEFLKEHKKVEEQQASIAELKSTVAQQAKGMEVLTTQLKEQAAQIQKVSAQLEVSKPAPQVVTNKP
jgi:hypothetical protein